MIAINYTKCGPNQAFKTFILGYAFNVPMFTKTWQYAMQIIVNHKNHIIKQIYNIPLRSVIFESCDKNFIFSKPFNQRVLGFSRPQ